MAALDGYARAVDGWAILEPGAREALQLLRERGYALGLLSNTWWAADWHAASSPSAGRRGPTSVEAARSERHTDDRQPEA